MKTRLFLAAAVLALAIPFVIALVQGLTLLKELAR